MFLLYSWVAFVSLACVGERVKIKVWHFCVAEALFDNGLLSVSVKLHFCISDVWIDGILSVCRQPVCLKRNRETEIISFVSSKCQLVTWSVFNSRLIAVCVSRGSERFLMTHRAERLERLFPLIEIWLLGLRTFLLSSSTGSVGWVKGKR